jgi:PTH1 family peptidyl-tRNA hydrolase
MKLIVGLGNPGKKYEKTWHNIGFVALDKIANEFDMGSFKIEKKFKSEIAIGQIGNEKVVLAKPQTFMNNSGEAVSAIVKYYKIDSEDIIIIHDDVDLPLERIKIVTDSSGGGNNGVKSIIQYLKTKNFWRIKVGIATAVKDKMDTADYVLSKSGLLQSRKVKSSIKKTVLAAAKTVEDGPSAMNQFN